MSLAKLPFILADAIGMRITATPPNPPSPPKEHIIPDWRERFLKSLAMPARMLRTLYWSAALIEISIILANQNPYGPISRHILPLFVLKRGTISLIRPTPLFIFGNLLTFYGTVLRIQCYRTLGILFSFELCIRVNHKLVTHGPYSYVRHPSYTAMIMTIVGAFISNLQGSWVRECGVLDTWIGRGLLLFWLLVAAAVILSLILRIPAEDSILKRQFGDEWIQWAEKVPYRLIPHIY
ncbi:hypothetical protein BDQ12DRAFT_615142 [Crucibulum laeve]|uniref:Protein-S-isoprenylcysteine O-methyltransferase n=1 Tax=Crucibulum laeve TaxID=68775 RepID=A0A5C3LKX5_9AGAR|nr:hypothetical protein BDQ12DRAFT_615142 [Crucibulum laeve]